MSLYLEFVLFHHLDVLLLSSPAFLVLQGQVIRILNVLHMLRKYALELQKQILKMHC